MRNTKPTLDVTAVARTTARFLRVTGGDQADFVAVEASDRDAGYYASLGQRRGWDATNRTLPSFTQAFAWTRALTEALRKPALWWQVPVGNASMPNEERAWQDNRVDYFLDHPDELAATHAFGVVFGAGMEGQTTPATDGGNLVRRMKQYRSSGGTPLCR
jgi:hypothetical protein